jgi:hypothetical protein
MGNCEVKEQIDEEIWCYLNQNFDKAVFRKITNRQQYWVYQRILENNWKKFRFKWQKRNNLCNDEVKYELRLWVEG